LDKTLLIFDIDDTLTESATIHQLLFKESLEELGVKNMNSNFGGYQHHTDSYISKCIFESYFNSDFDADKCQEFGKLLSTKMAKQQIIEIPGAKNILQKIKLDENYAICFATGSLRIPAIQKLKSINSPFSESLLVASDNIFERENIVLKAIEAAKNQYGIPTFKRMVSVGDGLWDLKTAANLNLEFVAIGNRNEEVLRKHGCKTHFPNFLNVELNDF